MPEADEEKEEPDDSVENDSLVKAPKQKGKGKAFAHAVKRKEAKKR